MTVGPAALEERILSGGDRRLQLAAARGEVDEFPRLRRVFIQVALTGSADAEVAQVASDALRNLPHLEMADVLERSANRQVLAYFADHSRDPVALETILRNQRAGADVIRHVLPKLPASLVHLLHRRQDVMQQDPTLIDLLPAASQRQLQERAEADAEDSEEVSQEVLTAIGEAFDLEASGGAGGPADPARLRSINNRLSEGQIRGLPVSARLKLCRGASRMLRGIMVRDPNPSVAVAVLEFNTLSDAEIESISGNRNVAGEVLSEIVRDRRWPRKRTIALALVKNPKVSAGAAIRLLATLSPKELRTVSMDSSVPSVVRSQAKQLYRIKTR